MKKSMKHWWDVIIFVIGIPALYLSSWLPATNLFKDTSVENIEFWQVLTSLTKDTVQSTVVATSILFPSSIAILGFLYHFVRNKQKKVQDVWLQDAFISFYHATFALVISLGFAIFNMTHVLMKLELKVSISHNWVVLTLGIIQFTFFFLGVWKMCRGAISLKGLYFN